MTDERRSGGQYFPAAVSAAVTARAVRIEDMMPSFAVSSRSVPLYLAIDDKPNANPSADRDCCETSNAAAGAAPEFPERGRVRIVLDVDRHTEPRLQRADEIGGSPAVQCVRVVDNPGAVIDRTRDSDPDPGQDAPGRRERSFNQVPDPAERELRSALRLSLDALAVQYLTGC
jgi:hypothetical protein